MVFLADKSTSKGKLSNVLFNFLWRLIKFPLIIVQKIKATKVSPNEALELEPKILHYAGGNDSLYIRAALLNYKPKKEDFKC